ncbi:hypothetical protein C8R45DRAFT_794839, partial [Mycena sanguinolenta]
MASLPNVPILPDGKKFDGTKWVTWKPKMTAQATLRGLYGYYDGTIPQPPPAPAAGPGTAATIALPPDLTPIFSRAPSLEEWTHCDSLATSLLVLNIKDPVGVGLKTDGTAHEAWTSLES